PVSLAPYPQPDRVLPLQKNRTTYQPYGFLETVKLYRGAPLAQWHRSRSVRDESGESTSVARTDDARSSRRRPNRWPRRAERSSPPSRGSWSWRALGNPDRGSD